MYAVIAERYLNSQFQNLHRVDLINQMFDVLPSYSPQMTVADNSHLR